LLLLRFAVKNLKVCHALRAAFRWGRGRFLMLAPKSQPRRSHKQPLFIAHHLPLSGCLQENYVIIIFFFIIILPLQQSNQHIQFGFNPLDCFQHFPPITFRLGAARCWWVGWWWIARCLPIIFFGMLQAIDFPSNSGQGITPHLRARWQFLPAICAFCCFLQNKHPCCHYCTPSFS